MLRWSVVLPTAVTACALAGGAGGRPAADLFSGTWSLAAASGTPWSGGGTLTITPTSSAAVPGSTGQPAWDNYVRGYCTGPPQPGGTAPKVSAWYSLTYSWSGGGRMGGCVSDKTNGQLIFFGAGSMGHITGRNGNSLFGDWTNNPNGQSRFTATLAASSPPSPATPAAGRRSKAVSEPAPGGTGTVSSPDAFPVDAAKVDVSVSSSAGNLSSTTIVGEGERTPAQAAGEAVAACWLIGPDALVITNESLKETLNDPVFKREFEKFSAQRQLNLCMGLVRLTGSRTAARTEAAAGGCRVQRLGFAIRSKTGHVVSVRLAKPTSTSVRYTCTASGGTAKITVDGRSKGGLRKALGTKLDLGVYRTKKAPRRTAKLTFAFGW